MTQKKPETPKQPETKAADDQLPLDEQALEQVSGGIARGGRTRVAGGDDDDLDDLEVER